MSKLSDRRAAAPLFQRTVENTVTGRTHRVTVNRQHDIELAGCDGPMTAVQAAAARTLLDEALAFIAEREGGGPTAQGLIITTGEPRCES
jgi:hypothetical protein